MNDLTRVSEREAKRDVSRLTHIVLHRSHLAETGEATAEWFKTHDEGGTGRKVPYNIYIRKDGTIEQLVPFSRVAPGAGVLNKTGIQVALCGDLRQYPPTPKQAMALGKVLQDLTSWLGKKAKIVGHTEVEGTSSDPTKECPGKHINLDGVRKLAEENYVPWHPAQADDLFREKGWVV